MAEAVVDVSESSKRVLSDPYTELPFRSDKYAGMCEEMHLAARGITHLHAFEAFKSMGALWINTNKLTSFTGLEKNFRIKEIYAHENRIQRLGEEVFTHMTFLNTITLNGNKLDDLENVIEELRPMRNLQVLDLFDNPLAQEDNYRLRMIGELDTLTVLDRHAISDEEREEAREYMQKMAKMNNFSLTKRKVVIPKFSPEETEHRRLTLESIIARFNEKTFKFRIALESYFVLHDKRSLGKCNEGIWWEVLDETNLSPLLIDDFEREVLADKYRVKFDVPATAPGGTMRKVLMYYRKFCEDVLRPEIRLLADETWHPNMAPEISVCTMDLTKYVKDVHTKTRMLSETLAREELAATRAASEAGGENVFGDRLAGKRNKCDEHGLNEFIAGELIKIVSSYSGGKVDNEKTFTIEQIESIMKKMANFSVVPEQGVKKAAEELSTNMLTESKKTFTAREIKDALGASIVSASPDTPIIKWRRLNDAEKEKLTSKLFTDAGGLLDTLLRLGPKDDGTELLKKTTLTSIHATRMASDFKRKNDGPTLVTPSMALSKAPNRADVIILPNLLPDIVKETKMKETLSKADWSQHLAKLGLKGEFLSVAIERKNRSILKQAAKTQEKEAMKKKMATSLVVPDPSGKPPRKPLVPPSDGGPKGWAASTGNVVIG